MALLDIYLICRKYVNAFCFFALLCVVGFSCSRSANDPPGSPPSPLSADKEITSFVFKVINNAGLSSDVVGTIGQDSIKLFLPFGFSLTNLNPEIIFKGKSISPQSGIVQNFMNSVTYTVTAEDGTKRSYNVVAKNTLSNSKDIISFKFKAINNPGLPTDISGNIGTDSISAILPNGFNLVSLIPSIGISGMSIFPLDMSAQNFTQPVEYMVTAQDGSIKKYKVVLATEAMPATLFVNTYGNRLGNPPAIGKIYALDANSGNVRWQHTPSSGTFGFSTPAFSNGALFTSNINKLVAFDTATRSTKWEFSCGGLIQSSIAFANGIVYSNCNDGYLYAVDANTGNLKWKFEQLGSDTIHSNFSSPTVVNGVVYFGSSRDQYVYAVDANTGALKWKTYNTLGSGIGIFQSSPVVLNGVLFIGDAYRNLFALDATSGTVKWAFASGGLFISSPTVVNGAVYIGSSDGYLYAINANDGSVKWTHWQPPQVLGSPIVSNGIVYIGTSGGSGSKGFYALDANTGTEKWVYTFGTDFDSSPVICNNTVYILSYSTLLALDSKAGTLKWKFSLGSGEEAGFLSPIVVDQKGTVYYPSISGNQD